MRLDVDIATLHSSGDSTGGFSGTEGERLHTLLVGEVLGKAQRVWSGLCRKEQSVEHD